MFFKQAWLSAFVLVMAVLPLSSCEDSNAQEDVPKSSAAAQQQGIPVRVGAAVAQDITEWSEFTGRFQALQRVEIRARVSGYLDEIKFEDGQIVQEGDVLFVIDQRPYAIALNSARARHDAAYNEHKRAKKLRSSKAISEEDYDARLQAMRIARADLDKAKLDMEFTQVKAPFTGRMSNSRIDVGNLVNGDATLLSTVVSTDPIEFYFEGSETDMLSYNRASKSGEVDMVKGYPVYLRLQDEKEFVHEGKINFIDNELARDTGTVRVRAVFDNKEGLFEAGMFARLRVAKGKAGVKMLVPQGIIGTEQTRKYVYVLDENNKAMRKYVILGSVTDEGMQVVTGGLSGDERIVMGGLHMVQPGALIMPMPMIMGEGGAPAAARVGEAGESGEAK